MKARPARMFRGLNNVEDPLRLGLEWFTVADNVDVTRKGAVTRARGYTRATTNTAITGAYATKDLQRLYLIDDGELRAMNRDLSYTVLRTGLSAQSTSFTEVNGIVYYANGVDFGTIEPQGARPWGIAAPPAPVVTAVSGSLPAGVYQVVCTSVDARGLESSNSDVMEVTLTSPARLVISGIAQSAAYSSNVYVTTTDGTVFYLLREGAGAQVNYDAGAPLGRELPYWNTNTPRGEIPEVFDGRMYISEWFESVDQTMVWCSLPMRYHHFDPGGEGFAVPGQVRMLDACAMGLIIGTDRQIFSYDGDKLKELAPYGVVPGWHAAESGGQLYFWSLRGLCRALPFVNITADIVSAAPGVHAGGTVVEKDGQRRYVVALQKGGEAYNKRSG